MSKSVYTLAQDTDATAAARMMLRHHLKCAPAVAGDRVVGIVARRDLLRLVARDDDDIRTDLQAASPPSSSSCNGCGSRSPTASSASPGPASSAGSWSWASPAPSPGWSRSAPATTWPAPSEGPVEGGPLGPCP